VRYTKKVLVTGMFVEHEWFFVELVFIPLPALNCQRNYALLAGKPVFLTARVFGDRLRKKAAFQADNRRVSAEREGKSDDYERILR
jgi:hypothetical protein